MRPIKPENLSKLIPVALAACLAASGAHATDVRFCTERGAIDVTLDDQRAPLHTANFLRYAESGFYGGTVIHHAVPGAMVQGGRYDRAFERRDGSDPVVNESGNGLSNLRGTIAAARSEDPNSATSQFFFNLSDNSHLDGSPGTPGYTVFGRVTAGLDVLDRIAAMPTLQVADLESVPNPPVVIRSVTALDRAPVFGVSIEPDPATLAADFDSAAARGDAGGILEAADALSQSCIALSSTQRVTAAEAAIELGRFDQARYALEAYLAEANALDPATRRAQELYARLTGTTSPVRTANLESTTSPARTANLPSTTSPARTAGPVSLPAGPGPTLLPSPEAVELSRDVTELIGHCRRPAPPTVPSGRFTEQPVLTAVGNEVRRYRQLGELYLTCVTQRLDRGDLNAEERNSVIHSYNEVVIEMTAVSVRFNAAARAYRASQPGSSLN
ncbi:MAG: peptidylprolyl isomerase [Gammaproteobacteria bacterium]|jgi:cyclophilin family peptidyl-prolyl cis-trans isomerase